MPELTYEQTVTAIIDAAMKDCKLPRDGDQFRDLTCIPKDTGGKPNGEQYYLDTKAARAVAPYFNEGINDTNTASAADSIPGIVRAKLYAEAAAIDGLQSYINTATDYVMGLSPAPLTTK